MFHIQVALHAGRWQSFGVSGELHWAQRRAMRAVGAKYDNGDVVFEGVRIKYRGLALQRWKHGELVR